MAKLVYDKTGRLVFTKEMKKEEYTILIPMMARITPMTLQLTMEITPEMKARLCGYKNLACYERARRRAKRAKEKYRRKRLKEGK